jgi:hypothetical protein
VALAYKILASLISASLLKKEVVEFLLICNFLKKRAALLVRTCGAALKNII